MVLTSFETAIKSFLDEYANDDPSFEKKYKNPDKSIKECCTYICKEVERSRKNGEKCVAVSDEEVYGMAIHYYDEENIAVEKPVCNVEVTQSSPVEAVKEEPEKKTRKPRKTKASADPEIPAPVEFPIF